MMNCQQCNEMSEDGLIAVDCDGRTENWCDSCINMYARDCECGNLHDAGSSCLRCR